jgi:hypothetical protein
MQLNCQHEKWPAVRGENAHASWTTCDGCGWRTRYFDKRIRKEVHPPRQPKRSALHQPKHGPYAPDEEVSAFLRMVQTTADMEKRLEAIKNREAKKGNPSSSTSGTATQEKIKIKKLYDPETEMWHEVPMNQEQEMRSVLPDFDEEEDAAMSTAMND